mmetsp:Transcript_15950/g.20809  ORF Transcript_15950/g.20809 Transcript_15950/m.20809 type:complete len:195 (-) Transcript_15950:55-639(-)|eukprot:CAMPEP_0117746400 /NCGR_PEP_ID=MMETSP0947-20121206/7923_1 /TAXON_ID=44440 /ORGANISM="Chattonella subsalsa, Strain CCMP2191" /LENGTH=194 /DNA_ID=CAMNT_0005563715 /DNA_START=101 /DNA_END=685 /DNA_ORIENTATION=-
MSHASHSMHHTTSDTSDSESSPTSHMSHMSHTSHSNSGHHGMYFNTNYEHSTLLFSGFHLHSAEEYAGAMIFTLALAIIYEGLKHFRNVLDQKFQELNMSQITASGIEADKDVENNNTIQPGTPLYYTLLQQICRSLLQGCLVFISMLLMLIFMTFDVGLAVMVCAGAGIGYGMFNRKVVNSSSNKISECCPDS